MVSKKKRRVDCVCLKSGCGTESVFQPDGRPKTKNSIQMYIFLQSVVTSISDHWIPTFRFRPVLHWYPRAECHHYCTQIIVTLGPLLRTRIIVATTRSAHEIGYNSCVASLKDMSAVLSDAVHKSSNSIQHWKRLCGNSNGTQFDTPIWNGSHIARSRMRSA